MPGWHFSTGWQESLSEWAGVFDRIATQLADVARQWNDSSSETGQA